MISLTFFSVSAVSAARPCTASLTSCTEAETSSVAAPVDIIASFTASIFSFILENSAESSSLMALKVLEASLTLLASREILLIIPLLL